MVDLQSVVENRRRVPVLELRVLRVPLESSGQLMLLNRRELRGVLQPLLLPMEPLVELRVDLPCPCPWALMHAPLESIAKVHIRPWR